MRQGAENMTSCFFLNCGLRHVCEFSSRLFNISMGRVTAERYRMYEPRGVERTDQETTERFLCKLQCADDRAPSTGSTKELYRLLKVRTDCVRRKFRLIVKKSIHSLKLGFTIYQDACCLSNIVICFCSCTLMRVIVHVRCKL